MSARGEYPKDREFNKLILRRRHVNLTVAALELAREFEPGLKFKPTLQLIDDRAHELSMKLLTCHDNYESLQVLSDELALHDGFHGTHDCYQSPESSYLHRVIEHRKGLPITLALVYLAVGNKAGLRLQGISTPMHFLIKDDTGREPLYLDAYHRGRIMSELECSQWLSDLIGIDNDLVQHCLRPAAPRSIMIRMLNNLKTLFIQKEDWTNSWRTQMRLSRLQPRSYEERRDLGFIALKVGRPGLCAELLSDCLRKSPHDEKTMITNYIDLARAEIAIRN